MNIQIFGEIYDLSLPTAGSPIAPYAPLLTAAYATRLQSRGIYFAIRNPAATPSEIASALAKFAADFVFDDSPEPDIVEQEAIEIAEEALRARLASQGLPAPRNLRDHALQIATSPAILSEARRRVTARIAAAREILGAHTP